MQALLLNLKVCVYFYENLKVQSLVSSEKICYNRKTGVKQKFNLLVCKEMFVLKRISMLLTVLTLLYCTACDSTESSVSEIRDDIQIQNAAINRNLQECDIPETVQADWEEGTVYEWRDYDGSHEFPFGEGFELQLELADFPDTVFIWRNTAIYTCADGVLSEHLVYGMPLWNAFFADLNADGYPELCTTVSIGSGIIDEHIVVYDYHNQKKYVLADRMAYDYYLYTEDNVLYVRKLPYLRGEETEAETGKLVLENGELIMEINRKD